MESPQLVINRKTEMIVDQQRVVSEKVEQVQRNYYPDRVPEVQHYMQESQPQIQQESYTVSYSSSSGANGHHDMADDVSSSGGGSAANNQHSSQVTSSLPNAENAQLISRTTQQMKTQQVKTVTKVYTSREVRHIGPDGQPIDYEPFGTLGPPPAPPSSSGGGDYGSYPPNEQLDYANYDQHYSGANGGVNYGMVPSPGGSGSTAIASAQQQRLYDPYSRNNQVGYQMDYHNYQDYPLNTSTTPSIMSESPPPVRRSSMGPPMNHFPQSGYDELDSTFQHHQQPQHSPYGYAPGPQQQMHSPGGGFYNAYDDAPQGYLDRRPSYDDHNTYGGSIHGPPQVPHSVFEEDETVYHTNPPVSRQGFPIDQLVAPDGSLGDVRWRDPDLHEVIEFLGHPNNIVRANAAAYLQHLCFMDDNMKSKTRALGGIPPLINLLSQEVPEIQRNSCGALRNLSYGRQNDENKRAIRNAGGIPALVRLLRKTVDNEIRELVTGVLWNLSSSEELKRPIIDDALTVLVNVIIIPHSGWDRSIDPSLPAPPGVMVNAGDIYWSTVFRNGSGVLRNVSSAGEYARRKLRECEGLVDALLFLVRAAIGKNDMDNKSVENCVCILRNLSYRCQEVIDPEYDKHYYANQNNSLSPSSSSRAAAIMGGIGNKVGDNLGCFGASKKKSKDKEQSSVTSPSATTSPINSLDAKTQQLTISGPHASGGAITPTSPPVPRPRSEPARGMELLWQTEVVQPYLALLSECSNPETLEAAAGAIQNLAACFWQPSIDIRGAVRKEKGLPILVELLRMEVDRVVCAVATALRNLAMDSRNKELIGKYALKDLVSKLPNGNPQHDSNASDDTVAAVLATLNEVIAKNPDFAKSLLEAGGMERLTIIVKQKGKFSPRVSKFTSQLLFNMWQHIELREVYRKAGWKESHFIINSRTLLSRTTSSSNSQSANNTLTRPMSTVGGTRYEDRTLPRGGGRDLNVSQLHGRPEELALSDMNQTDGILSPNQQQPLLHRPPIGGVPIYPPGATYIRSPTSEPVYAQVNRERKKQTTRPNDTSSQTALLGSENYILDQNDPIYPPTMPAGDSWV